ncbi:MAG: hypothetical protein DMG69_27845 [Acidobacteria bacterium]|nr:MAG: hypothetical protein DMG69_27845 [Acidobacteriota bacterium]
MSFDALRAALRQRPDRIILGESPGPGFDHTREDVGKINDPKAQALFETTAEVLTGLSKAYED